jgi:NOL1/NOP2/fmu family ribosome biogenesis protein
MNTMEDEDIVTYICSELGARCLPLPSTLVSYGIPSENHPDALRFLPDNEGTEGQFIAALQKLGGQENSDFPLSRKEQERLQSPGPWLVDAGKQYLPTSTKDDYFVYKEEVRLLPVIVKEAALHILSKLSISSLGVSVFEQIGRKVTPLQGLATLVNYPLTCNTLDLTLPQALTYLKREDLRETIDCSPGIFLATYKGFGLGWIKAIQGGRVNNLLPTNRRIRMDLPILE